MKMINRRAALAAATGLGVALRRAPAWAQQTLTPLTFQLKLDGRRPERRLRRRRSARALYRQAGLDVTIVAGNGSGNTAQLVASGRASVAYADAVPVSQLIAKGAPMKIVSTVYQSNQTRCWRSRPASSR